MSRSAPIDVIRLALTPRWLLLAAVALVFMAAAILLGRWQWERTQDILAAERAAQSQPVAIEQALPMGTTTLPDEVTGQPVIVNGTYEPSMQVAVTNRELAGNPGVWMVTGLRMADGRVAAVLRGWLTSADEAAALVPPGPVSVTGVLQPNESFYADAASAPGTVASISSDRLARLWNTTVVPGYTVLRVEQPPRNAAPAPVPQTVNTGDVPFPLQNFVYAFQWWIFAAFAAFVYARWLLLEAKERQDEQAAG
jgi:cytochrome oxidase assembly protein ShyY1